MTEYYTNAIQWGNTIFYRGVKNGKRIMERVQYEPTLFIKTNTESKYKSLDGINLEPMKFPTIKDAKNFIEEYKQVDNFNVFGNTRFLYTFLADRFKNKVEFGTKFTTKDLCIAYIDIEVASSEEYATTENPTEEITAISVRINQRTVTFGFGDFVTTDPNIKYIKCKNESALLNTFLEYWDHVKPDIVSGWNVNFFDIPYLVNRISRVMGEDASKRMSPWKMVNAKRIKYKMREMAAYELFGISILDYMELYDKFIPVKQESMKLNYIAYVELGEQKIQYDGSLEDLRLNDHQKFIEYNIKDTELVENLDNKLQLMAVAANMAYTAKANFYDVFAPTRICDAMFYNHFKKHSLVFDPEIEREKTHKYAGAFVKDTVPGLYNWLISFDLDSLYPNTLIQLNISPETLRPEFYRAGTFFHKEDDTYDVSPLLEKRVNTDILKERNVCMAANGHSFTNEKLGFIPEILAELYDERRANKNRMIKCEQEMEGLMQTDPSNPRIKFLEGEVSKFDNFQNTQKLLLNSCYGALGTKYFRFYDTRLAEAITLSGQVIIQKIAIAVNKYLNTLVKLDKEKDFVVASDTDSIYICLDSIVKKFFKDESDKNKIINFIDEFAKTKIQKVINDSCRDLQEYLNSKTNRMNMKREAIADRGIWTGKKRYFMNIWDKEGIRYTSPRIKIKGLEAIKSSTPEICRKNIKKALEIMINHTERDFQKFVKEFKDVFCSMPPEDISSPKGCNGMTKYHDSKNIFTSGTPIHVRGALIYNHLLEKNNLKNKYEPIKSGDKVRYTYLKKPNSINDHAISFVSVLPKEFDLHKYIDYNTQFEKTFLDPLKLICDAISWNVEYKPNLVDIFF